MGKDIEQRGSEWICPKCKEKQQPSIKVFKPNTYNLFYHLGYKYVLLENHLIICCKYVVLDRSM